MVTVMSMGTYTEVGMVGVGSREGEGGAGGVVVGTRAEDNRATERQAPMTRLSVLPSECLP